LRRVVAEELLVEISPVARTEIPERDLAVGRAFDGGVAAAAERVVEETEFWGSRPNVTTSPAKRGRGRTPTPNR
jgi:hypothetical protein